MKGFQSHSQEKSCCACTTGGYPTDDTHIAADNQEQRHKEKESVLKHCDYNAHSYVGLPEQIKPQFQTIALTTAMHACSCRSDDDG